MASRIVLVPIIAGISYEFIRFAGKHQSNIWIRLINSPNILLQDLTTRQPDDGMMEVAITAIEYAIAMDDDRAVPSDDKSELSSAPFEPVTAAATVTTAAQDPPPTS